MFLSELFVSLDLGVTGGLDLYRPGAIVTHEKSKVFLVSMRPCIDIPYSS